MSGTSSRHANVRADYYYSAVLYEAMIRLVAPLCTYLPHAIEPVPIASVTTIIDLGGVSLKQMWALRNHLQEASVLANQNYPETLGVTIVVNAPSFFSTVWGWIKVYHSIIHPQTNSYLEINRDGLTRTPETRYMSSATSKTPRAKVGN